MSELSLDIVLCALPERQQEAEQMAKRFNLPLADKHRKARYKLWLGAEHLELQDCQAGAPGPVYVDFTEGRALYRRLHGGGKNQPLAKAVGIKDKFRPSILDATAGLGRDAFVLATLGCKTTLLERSPIFAALLTDGIARAQLHQETMNIAKNMQIIHADARNYLGKLANEQRPDTIYIDPMYPHRNKSALVKKEMRIARELVGDDEDACEILEIALETASKRVAVKRPSYAETLGSYKPTAAIKSKSTRYDIYIV